jgi:hypothetical protein
MSPTPFFGGASFFSIAAVGLTVAALLTNNWYTITRQSGTTTYGLWKVCNGGSCQGITYEDFSVGTCYSSKATLQSRSYGVMATAILGGSFAACTFFVSLVGLISKPKTPILAGTCFGLSAVGFCGFIVAVVLYIFIYQNWYYCNENYCNKAFALVGESGACDAFFSYSYALIVIAAGCSLSATVFSLVAMKSSRAAPTGAPITDASARTAQEPNTNAKTPGRAAAAGASPAGKQGAQKAATRQAPAQAAGMDGWELDERNGLYWSDKEMLFYDPNSGHFYDPNSELWYDPQTEQWYQGAES